MYAPDPAEAEHTMSDDEFHTLQFRVTHEVYTMWLELKARAEKVIGAHTDERVLEMAVVETLNIPEGSYSTAAND